MVGAEVLGLEHPSGAIVRNGEDHTAGIDPRSAEERQARGPPRLHAHSQDGRPVSDLSSPGREESLESMEKIGQAAPGKREPARPRRRLEDSIEHAREEPGRSLARSFVQGGERDRPEHRRQVLGSADFPEPGFDREAGAVSVSLEQRPDLPGKVEGPEAGGSAQPVAGSDRGDPVEGSGKIGTAKLEGSAPALPEAQVKRSVRRERFLGAEAAQEAEGLRVERGQNVLPVVFHLARRGIDPARGAPAWALSRLEHEHARTLLRERGCRGDAGKSGPDHDRVEGTAHRAA